MKETQLVFPFAERNPPIPPAAERQTPAVVWDGKEAGHFIPMFGRSPDERLNEFLRALRNNHWNVEQALELEREAYAQTSAVDRKEVARARRDHL